MVKSSAEAQAGSKGAISTSKEIDDTIGELDDWRGTTFAKVREIIRESDPEIVEEIKWRKPTNPAGVPVWSRNGGICTGEIYKDHLKFTFFKGVSLDDPSHLFTQHGSTRCAIDFYEEDKINEKSIKALVREAVALNLAGKS